MDAVVICFKFSNFAYANTVLPLTLPLSYVVICFKFSNFAYANTVTYNENAHTGVLLFALNLVTLLMQIQLYSLNVPGSFCCYLL